MKKLLPKSLNNPRGFSLIELLVVVSIIAILSVIGVTVFTGVQKNARDSRRRGDIEAITKALEVNKTATGYVALAASQFSGAMPLLDPQGYPYCGNSALNPAAGQPADPAAVWTTTCPANYLSVSTTIPVPATGATSWKICTFLETTPVTFFCRSSSQ